MWPFYRIMLNGQALPTRFVSKDKLKATLAPRRYRPRAPTASRSSAKEKRFLIILACQIVLQIDIRSDNQIVLSDRKALLGSRVAFIFDRGWVRV